MKKETNDNIIYSSTEYHKFCFLKGNRPIKQSEVDKKISSLEQSGMMVPGLCQETQPGSQWKFIIMEGQHRFKGCEVLKIPFRFLINNFITLLDIINSNEAQTKWLLSDFLHCWIAQKKEEYLHVQDFLSKYNLPMSLAITLLSGSGNGQSIAQFKKGEFEAKDTVLAEEIGNALILLKEEVPCYKNSRFILALSKCLEVPEFNIQQFIEQSKKYKIGQCSDWSSYLNEIDRVYSYNRKTNRFDVAHSVKKIEEEKTHQARLEREKNNKKDKKKKK